jgi:hypothetical protein
MADPLPIVNLAEAKHECIFGRGCDGICCKNGRPPVYPEEADLLDQNLAKFKRHMRPEAVAVLDRHGYLSQRRKSGLPMMRVVGGWCIFFNQGCVLHKVGAAEGDKYRYKPAPCALFPLSRDDNDQWYIRQKDYKNEDWDLFCLDPEASPVSAAESLREEIALAARYTAEEETAPEVVRSATANGRISLEVLVPGVMSNSLA